MKTPRKKAAPTKKAPAKKAPKKAAKKAAAGATKRTVGRRADFGAPIEGFFAKQPPHLRAILEALRALVEETAPEAEASLKWGMPFYPVAGKGMCALGAHKAHVNRILWGPADAFPDPDGRLLGEGAEGRHLRLTSLDELPRAAVRRWLRAAANLARGK